MNEIYFYFIFCNMRNELPSFEKHEEPELITKTLTSSELVDFIYKGEALPQDERFISQDKGGVFKYFDLSEITNPLSRGERFFPLIELEGEVIGLAELEKKPEDSKTFWIKFLSIDSEYQNKGYASKLAEEIFRFAQKEDISLETSSYSEIGYQKLKSLFKRLAEEMSVNFIDTERKI